MSENPKALQVTDSTYNSQHCSESLALTSDKAHIPAGIQEQSKRAVGHITILGRFRQFHGVREAETSSSPFSSRRSIAGI